MDDIVESYAFNLPSLTVVNCTPPRFPHEGLYSGYVGKMTTNGLLLCGGISPKNERTFSSYADYVANYDPSYDPYHRHSSCSLLSEAGRWETVEEMVMPGQYLSALSAVDTDEGWWVTGKNGTQ